MKQVIICMFMYMFTKDTKTFGINKLKQFLNVD